jgi:glycosyltransferase involved in cell wall biosynthesis
MNSTTINKKVDVILSIYKEDFELLRNTLASIFAQSYKNFGTIIVYSTENDLANLNLIIARLRPSKKRRKIQLIASTTRNLPHNLNKAIEASNSEIIVRVDSHSFLQSDYIESAVKAITELDADVVGGSMVPITTSKRKIETAIAMAMSNTATSGFGRYRTPQQKLFRKSNSVYLGVYKKETLQKLGAYDETLKRGQDWELNMRISANHGKLYFSSSLQTLYSGRKTLLQLVKQQLITGYYRAHILRAKRYSFTTKIKYLLPPISLLVLMLLFVTHKYLEVILLSALYTVFVLYYMSLTVRINNSYDSSMTKYIKLTEKQKNTPYILMLSIVLTPLIQISWSVGYISNLFALKYLGKK